MALIIFLDFPNPIAFLAKKKKKKRKKDSDLLFLHISRVYISLEVIIYMFFLFSDFRIASKFVARFG